MINKVHGLENIHEIPSGWYWLRFDDWGYEGPIVVQVTQDTRRVRIRMPYPDEFHINEGEYPDIYSGIKLVGPLEVPPEIS